jgi:phosphoribosylformimino-5-aminoimidazole carboxamide ribotide isomerase
MIIIPSFTISDLSAPALTLDLLAEWAWYGFSRFELTLTRPPETYSERRNLELVCRECTVPIRLDVEVSDLDDMASLFDAGAASMITGSRALEDADWLQEAVDAFPDLLAVRIPARERRVRARGALRVKAVDLADEIDGLAGLRLAAIVVAYGTEALTHRDLADLEDLVSETQTPIGVSTSEPTIETFRDLEFRGASAVIAPHVLLNDVFDTQTLARSFAD